VKLKRGRRTAGCPRCKRLQESRFGFLDFLTPRHATSALSNRKNHFFQGRKLVLQVSTIVHARHLVSPRNLSATASTLQYCTPTLCSALTTTRSTPRPKRPSVPAARRSRCRPNLAVPSVPGPSTTPPKIPPKTSPSVGISLSPPSRLGPPRRLASTERRRSRARSSAREIREGRSGSRPDDLGPERLSQWPRGRRLGSSRGRGRRSPLTNWRGFTIGAVFISVLDAFMSYMHSQGCSPPLPIVISLCMPWSWIWIVRGYAGLLSDLGRSHGATEPPPQIASGSPGGTRGKQRPATTDQRALVGALFVNLSFTSYIPHLQTLPRSVLVPALLIRPLRVVLGAAGFSALQRCTSEWETSDGLFCGVRVSSRDKRLLVSRRVDESGSALFSST
jgi:hypothetical protein